ncbi:hypothetical protein [Asanoa siamensis]|uniref:YbaB/EbfC DNA-binding family protein n=1 Tax=Asanoa siamensis TaxID=926357 RepID=A0ABQ4D5A2_9ACTN|nr:hypothetical protein [Asanoa siamensis]GIF78443.1 hypothetical protein Asi02nite_79610 [Asanoa siamensis]
MSTDSGSGSAFAGQVRALASAGRLDLVDLDPQVLRLEPDEISAYAVEATNAALAGSIPRAPDDAALDPAALDAALRPAIESGAAMMRTVSDSLAEVMFRLRERTGMDGDPGTHGFAALLDETSDLLRIARGTMPAEHEQTFDGGLVVATVAAGPRVVALDIRDRTDGLGAEILVAVNSALDELADAARDLAPTDRLDARVRELQDASLAHMNVYTGALRTLLGSISGPPARERSDDE